MHSWFIPPSLPVATANTEEKAAFLDSLIKSVASASFEQAGAFAKAMQSDDSLAAVIHALIGHSPFLTRLAYKDSETFYYCMHGTPDAAFTHWQTQLIPAYEVSLRSQPEAMALLRNLKRQIALICAIGEISCYWTLEKVTSTLSNFADYVTNCALYYALHHCNPQPATALPTDMAGCGFFCLAMGKWGAHELNYSSDIDFMVLFDRKLLHAWHPEASQQWCNRVVQLIIQLLQERTKEGYVFRTDLRLRPDPASTPLAVSSDAALHYYESLGQNWERAAFIRARATAGDIGRGNQFLEDLRPFIWRKSLDFYAIEDIQSVKRQIDSRHGSIPPDLLGHNIKLGHGGIREIEFYTQTQQLIWGGREPELRLTDTCKTLAKLAEHGKITELSATQLSAAYHYLRRVEHHLQIIDDQQTHSLPQEETQLEQLAAFLGYADTATFRDVLRETLGTVRRNYINLFESSDDLSGGTGNLSFTGTEDDPGTLATLEAMGYATPANVTYAVRLWHHGHSPATRSARARGLLTELTPALLKAFANTPEPDAAFKQFDKFLHKLPSGIQLFAMLQSNQKLLFLLADIMGSTPELAEILAKQPSLLDALLEPDFFATLPDASGLSEQLIDRCRYARHYEELLDTIYRFKSELNLQAGIHLLAQLSTPAQIGTMLSDLADVILLQVITMVKQEFDATHGKTPPEGSIAIIALGKFGGQELTFQSDLDMILVYESDDDGGKNYFQRLAQRINTTLNAMSPYGRLYETDLRLRPFGNDAPMATNIQTIHDYYSKQAWAFELMALTRYRIVTADDDLHVKLDAMMSDILCQPRDYEAIGLSMQEMRLKIVEQHSYPSAWELKYTRGGTIDIEFVAQFMLLCHGNEHPDLFTGNTISALERISEHHLLGDEEITLLLEGAALMFPLQSALRLIAPKDRASSVSHEGTQRFLCRITGYSDFTALEAALYDYQQRIYALFPQLMSTLDRVTHLPHSH